MDKFNDYQINLELDNATVLKCGPGTMTTNPQNNGSLDIVFCLNDIQVSEFISEYAIESHSCKGGNPVFQAL